MICPNCGRESMSAEVCPHCGAAVDFPLDDDAAHQTMPLPTAPSSVGRAVTDVDHDGVYGLPTYTNDGVLRIFGAPSPSGSLSPEAAGAPHMYHSAEVPNAHEPPTPDITLPSPTVGHLIVHRSADHWAGSGEQAVPLDGRDITIGRSPTCTIALEDDILVSRLHAVIRLHDNDYAVVDLASSNGTFVNGEPITEERTLREGDHIRVGDCDIIYSKAPPPALAAAPPSELAAAPATGILPAVDNDTTASDLSLAQTYPPVPWQSEGSDSRPGTTPLAGAAAMAAMSLTPDGSPSAPISPALLAQAQAPTAPPPPARNFDALHAQLTDMVGQLRQQAETASNEMERLRAAVAAVSTTLAMLLQAERQRAEEEPDLPALIQLAESTVESPRNLDNVIAFATQAPDIAVALRALRDIRSSEGLIEAVDSLRARLAAAALGANA